MLRTKLSWEYPHRATTERKAKSSVTALRREAEALDDEAEQIFAAGPAPKRPARTLAPSKSKLSAAETGLAHHKFLQHFSLKAAAGVKSLEAEAKRLESAKILSAAERAALDLEALADFWNSE